MATGAVAAEELSGVLTELRTTGIMLLGHLHIMDIAPAFCSGLLRRLVDGKAFQKGFEPCEQALFVRLLERKLDLETARLLTLLLARPR
jgi:hypothetical protein